MNFNKCLFYFMVYIPPISAQLEDLRAGQPYEPVASRETRTRMNFMVIFFGLLACLLACLFVYLAFSAIATVVIG